MFKSSLVRSCNCYMANEIVKYGNELNMVVFRKFTANEMNLFFSIVSRMREKGSKTVTFTWNELRYLSKYKPTSTKRFIDDLNSTYSKMLQLNYGSSYISNNKLTVSRFILFTGFDIIVNVDNQGNEIDTESGYVEIALNPKLEHILNDLESWTRYSLEEFIDLKSTYSKTMFRLLKQYRTTGKYIIKMEDFKELLDIPKSYRLDNIDARVLKPISDELSSIFKNLRIEKNKSKKRGNKVLGYTFTFTPEGKNADDFKHGTKCSVKGIKKEVLPDWAKKNINESEENKMLSDEDQEKFNKRLEKFRNSTK